MINQSKMFWKGKSILIWIAVGHIYFCKWKAKVDVWWSMMINVDGMKKWYFQEDDPVNWKQATDSCVYGKWVWQILGLKKKRHLSNCGLQKDSRISFSFSEDTVNQENRRSLGFCKAAPLPQTLHWFLSDGNKDL